MDTQKNTGEIVFPCLWEFRAFCFCDKADAAQAEISRLARETDAAASVVPGEVSKSGTYRTVRVSAVVQSREGATALAKQIAEVDGVKMIL